jgi:hypothetical protein
MGPGQLGHPVVEGRPGRPAPVVRVDAPGSVEAYRGNELVGKLQRGRLSGTRMDPFESEWLPGQFSGLLEDFVERHEAARNRARDLGRKVGAAGAYPPAQGHAAHDEARRERAARRAPRRNGDFRSPENAGEPSREHPYIDLRSPFADERARLCFPDLVVDILNRLAQLYGTADHEQEPGAVGWEEFERTTDDEIETLDEAFFDVAHLIAGLAADGAPLMRVASRRGNALLTIIPPEVGCSPTVVASSC